MRRTYAVALLAALIGAALPATPAAAAPKIALLWPSPFADTEVPQLSDKGRPVHLTAWTQGAPATAIVEFEIGVVDSPLPSQQTQTVTADSSGPDTWEGFWAIPEPMTDGSYTVTARLYDGSDEIASATQPVTINQSDVPPPAAAETVEMIYPTDGGELGFYTPKSGEPNALISVSVSGYDSDSDTDSAQQVRAMYSKTDPGSAPAWTECGSEGVTQGSATIRCTLAEGDAANSVTAVAVATNSTPAPGPPDPLADGSGDAHRVEIYEQKAATIIATPEAVKADVGTCQLIDAVVLDQHAHPIAGANIDMHAQGPSDQLRFATDDIAGTPFANTDAYQAPDAGTHPSKEPTVQCSNKATIDTQEADHNVVGAADRKHIESVDGTTDKGAFTFALYSPEAGQTRVTLWADDNDDDDVQIAEAVGSAGIGWGADPPTAETELLVDPRDSSSTTGSCQQVNAIVRQGGDRLQGVNVDVHIKGPDATAQFCAVPGGTGHAPDQGGHTGDQDPDGSRHLEGETDSTGTFAFGVTSASPGDTIGLVWLDANNDDIQTSGELSRDFHIGWGERGDRSISLRTNKSTVPKGTRVNLSGSIDGSAGCSNGQVVRLQRRSEGSRRFRTIDSTATGSDGSYSFKATMRKTSYFRTRAPAAGACEKARSNRVKVKVS